MAITRSQAERILIRRVGALFTTAGLDGVSQAGDNPDLVDPIVTALHTLGLTVADVADVQDADLSGLVLADYNAFFDLAEYRALGNILGNLDLVDITVGPRTEKLSQLSDQVEDNMEQLRKTLQDVHNVHGGTLEMGAINMNFATKGDDDIV